MNTNGMNIIRAIGAGKGWSGSSEWLLDTPRNRIVLRDRWGFDCLIEGTVIVNVEDQVRFLAKAEGMAS